MSNWAEKLNDPRGRVGVIVRLNRRWPWLKIVLAVILIPLLIVTVMAWRIWLNSPQREELIRGAIAERGVMVVDEGRKEDLVTLVTTIPAEEEQINAEQVERMEVRILQRLKRTIPAGKPLVALTFDDGPSSLTTPRLLDELKSRGVRATFFMLGRMARANPEVVRRVYREGHEIGSHTMYHRNLIRFSEDVIRADVGEANQVFLDILGEKPALTRAPYGNVNATMARVVETPFINWTVDTNDWRAENREQPQRILETAVFGAFDGAIVLMHDIYPTTVDVIGKMIEDLQAHGYELVTISEMAEARGVMMRPVVEYGSFRP